MVKNILDWTGWKLRQLKKWLAYSVLYRALWKKLWISESDRANWEILHNLEKKTVTLQYVPEDDYGDRDVRIEVPYDHFEDLVKFMIRIR
jgi:hypothetical protein